MARAEVQAGICGFQAVVVATPEGNSIRLNISSECPRIQKLAEILTEVDGFSAIGPRSQPDPFTQAAAEAKLHLVCAVPCAIIKTVEVASGLALPRDVHIHINQE